MKKLFHIVLTAASIVSCHPSPKTPRHEPPLAKHTETPISRPARDSSAYEKLYVRKGLVNVASIDSTIRVVLMYNTDLNFIGKKFYGGLDQCYLPLEAATKLGKAQRALQAEHPFYSLVIFDAARPLHIQKMMWDSLKMKPVDKYNYVARPDEYSLHNYGAAVDLSIINQNGVLLDMGTPFDHFGGLAQPKMEKELVASGKLSRNAYGNRLLLRKIMMDAGFNPITSEWWHFNSCTKAYAAEHYTLIE